MLGGGGIRSSTILDEGLDNVIVQTAMAGFN